VIVVLVLASMVLAAVLPYFVVERGWRWRWREVEIGRLPVQSDGALYREGGTVPDFLERAPRLVRAAAFSCLMFGQMFIPGLCLGAFGLVAGGLGVVSIPGLITAAKLYGAGLALLRREPAAAYAKAKSAALWALWLNGVIAGLSVFAVGVAAVKSAWGICAFVGLVNVYGALSVGQALFLLFAIRRYEDALFQPSGPALRI
jgi:hypothetical protein